MRFGSESERDRALSEMAGHIISNRPVRVSIATAKKSPALAAAGVSPAGVSGQVLLGDMDPTNTTLFIGGLNAAVRERTLRCMACASHCTLIPCVLHAFPDPKVSNYTLPIPFVVHILCMWRR